MNWNKILDMMNCSVNRVSLNESVTDNSTAIRELQIDEFSSFGQVILHVNRMVINGYLRIFGEHILEINRKVKNVYHGNKIVIATDVFGGIFAINNGDFCGNRASIWYFAPDTLEWEDLNIDYTHFLQWVCSEDFNTFYSSFLWSTADDIIRIISDDEAVLVYPFLWSNECNIETASKKILPFDELLSLNAEYKHKFDNE